jgi:hypothetical protein
MRLVFLPIAVASATAAACAHRPSLPPLELTVSGVDAGCRFESEGRVVAEGPLAEAGLAAAARALRGRRVTVRGDGNAPFKCIGLAVYVLQREIGPGRTGFVAEPLPRAE